MSRLCQVFLIILGGLFLLLFGPFLWCFTYPLTHDYIRTDHPPSPHKPPSSYSLTREQVRTFRQEGVLILRQVMPPDLMAKLAIAFVHDVFRDAVLHSPLSQVASQLMGNTGVRIFNTFSMGVESDKIVPLRSIKVD